MVGHYDKLLAYADPKAESFFALHGFSDDPILTTVLRCSVLPSLPHSLSMVLCWLQKEGRPLGEQHSHGLHTTLLK